MKLAEKILNIGEAVSNIPDGFYEVKKFFRVGFGAWSMTFRPGQILSYKKRKLEQWDALSKTFKTRKPPIQGRETFDLTAYDDNYEQKIQIKKFLDNVESLKEKEFNKRIMASLPEITGTVKDVMKKMKDLPPKTKVKLIVEK